MYPFAIQAMSLADPWNLPFCQACVLLIEMLGFDSHPLRISLCVLDRLTVASSMAEKAALKEVGRHLMADQQAALDVKAQLEGVLLTNGHQDFTTLIENWDVAVTFCSVYGLDPPVQFLQQCARWNQWLPFLLFIQRYNYPLHLFQPILQVCSLIIRA